MSTKTIIVKNVKFTNSSDDNKNNNNSKVVVVQLKSAPPPKKKLAVVATTINKRAKLAKIKQRKEVLRLAGANSRFPATTWDLIKKRVGCIRLKKEAYALLEQIVVERMEAVLSRTLVISDRKMLHASDIHTALDSLNSSVAI